MSWVYELFEKAYYYVLSLFYQQELNLVVLGFPNSGKTTLVNRILGKDFEKDTIPTIGVDFKYVTKNNLMLKIFDISGQERFQSTVWKQYYLTTSDLIIYMIDLSDPMTIELSKRKLMEIIVQTNDRPVPIVILGNKVDLLKEADFISLGGVIGTTSTNNNNIELVAKNDAGSGNSANNVSNESDISARRRDHLGSFMRFLGLEQHYSQDKFILRRKVTDPNITRAANITNSDSGSTKKIIIEQGEEEVIELDRDLAIFLVNCQEIGDIEKVLTWLMAR